MKNALLSLIFISFALPAMGLAQDPVENPSELCSHPNLKHSVLVNGHVFESFQWQGGDWCLQVVENGRVIFRRTSNNGGMVVLGQPESKEDRVPGIPNGTDITGRGHPDMIVSVFTGGAHCCLMHYVFEL